MHELVVQRELKVCLIFPLHQAESIAKWMLDKVEKAKEEAAKRSKKPKAGEDI